MKDKKPRIRPKWDTVENAARFLRRIFYNPQQGAWKYNNDNHTWNNPVAFDLSVRRIKKEAIEDGFSWENIVKAAEYLIDKGYDFEIIVHGPLTDHKSEWLLAWYWEQTAKKKEMERMRNAEK